MYVLCVANQKGGVGKTTTAIHVAALAAWAGQKVLLCDLDAQANATSGLGLKPATASPPQPVSSGRDRLDVLFLGAWLRDRRHTAYGPLAQLLHQQDYDLTILDCPPAFGHATDGALDLSDGVLVPIQCEYFAMEGLTQILRSIDASEARRGRGLPLLGIVLTLYEHRLAVSVEVAGEVRRSFPDQTFSREICRDSGFVEASSYGKTLFEYDIRSPGAWDYVCLTREVLSNVRAKVGAQAV